LKSLSRFLFIENQNRIKPFQNASIFTIYLPSRLVLRVEMSFSGDVEGATSRHFVKIDGTLPNKQRRLRAERFGQRHRN
jgi:hypothetical protein